MSDQQSIDAFYAANGPCCAGCDFWRWINPLVGECVRLPPNQSHDAAAGIGLTGCSLPRSTSNLTLRSQVCGEFRDEDQTVETVRLELEQAQARFQRLEARASVEGRKLDARRKIIAGSLLLDALKAGTWPRDFDDLMSRITRDVDRKAFDGWSLTDDR